MGVSRSEVLGGGMRAGLSSAGKRIAAESRGEQSEGAVRGEILERMDSMIAGSFLPTRE